MKDLFKRAQCGKVDVGGYRCPCCGPRRKDRAKFRRATRRRMKQTFQKEMNKFLE